MTVILLRRGRRKTSLHAGGDDKGLGVCQEEVQNNALALLAKAKEPEKGRERTL